MFSCWCNIRHRLDDARTGCCYWNNHSLPCGVQSLQLQTLNHLSSHSPEIYCRRGYSFLNKVDHTKLPVRASYLYHYSLLQFHFLGNFWCYWQMNRWRCVVLNQRALRFMWVLINRLLLICQQQPHQHSSFHLFPGFCERIHDENSNINSSYNVTIFSGFWERIQVSVAPNKGMLSPM